VHDDRICNKMKKKNSRNSRKIYTPNTHTHDHPQIYSPNTHTHDHPQFYAPNTHTHDHPQIYTPNTHTHDHPQIYTPNTHTHDRQLSWLGTDTYLKSGGVKLSNHRYILQNKC
jgi:hypothetical protein